MLSVAPFVESCDVLVEARGTNRLRIWERLATAYALSVVGLSAGAILAGVPGFTEFLGVGDSSPRFWIRFCLALPAALWTGVLLDRRWRTGWFLLVAIFAPPLVAAALGIIVMKGLSLTLHLIALLLAAAFAPEFWARDARSRSRR